MLNRIKVENFKSLKRLDYACAKLNLLTGVNGAGKSSFVQLLRLLREMAPRASEPCDILKSLGTGGEIAYQAIHYCYDKFRDTRFEVAFSQKGGGEEFQLKRVIDECFPRDLQISHPDYNYEYHRAHADLDAARLADINGKGPVGDMDAIAQKCHEEFSVWLNRIQAEEKDAVAAFKEMWKGARFIDALRKKPCDVNRGGTYFDLDFMIEDYDVEEFDPEGGDVSEFLYKGKELSRDNSLLEKVNECLQWVSPGARLLVDQKKVGEDEYYISSVAFGKDPSSVFKPQNVGFGISYILPVLVTLLTAKRGSIIIIENPEAHLHPRGQAEMGRLIAETVARGVQVFVETHSDHVINGIRVSVKKGVVNPEDVNIAFFERKAHDVKNEDEERLCMTSDGMKAYVKKGEGSHREIYAEVQNIKVDGNGSLSEYPADFMDEWNNQLMKLIK